MELKRPETFLVFKCDAVSDPACFSPISTNSDQNNRTYTEMPVSVQVKASHSKIQRKYTCSL